MIFVIAFALVLLSVVLARGDVRKLGALRFRWIGLLLAALAIQVLVISILHLSHALDVTFHIASYVLVSGFLVANWRIAGMPILALGAMLNFLAISANGGVMPANPHALRRAGFDRQYAHFENSQALKHPKLPWIGDEFAIPKSWPVHNVFSVGDVLIIVGAAIGIHQVCETRLTRAGRGPAGGAPQGCPPE
ncbi:MAG: DUF5317 domain-containing protein [Actinobacteria bacterium]|nr:DUF5317 domain-containing protein [Actinomycetota bacterium]MBV9933961.1 DUF5317 domain-containing protein [Actinomycetota bacterium]